MEENATKWGKVLEANARLKAVEHKQFQEQKANHANAIKMEEEHKYALSKLVENVMKALNRLKT